MPPEAKNDPTPDFHRLRRLFEQARPLPDAERAEFVQRVRAEHPALGEELEALLAHAKQPTPSFEPDTFAASVDSSSGNTERSPDKVHSTNTEEILQRLARSPRLDVERYAIEGEVDRGGMGAILRILDRQLNRRLAMKVLLERESPRIEIERQLASQLLGRFLEEAQVTSQLDHPGVVPVHELGLDQHGKVYFTMRLVKGRTAREVFVESHGGSHEWPLTRALEIVLRVCDTMSYAHDKGVLHRDLKPDNVMVGRFGEVYVMDWGLAKVLGQQDRRDLRIRPDAPASESQIDSARRRDAERDDGSSVVSMDGQWLGTPSYMPPEQARGEELDERADVYAVGAMLYHLLTGHAPYTAPGVTKTAYRILDELVAGPPKAIEELQKGVPAELVAIVGRSMARDREHRYHDTAALAADLRAFLALRAVQAYRTGALVELQLWVRRNKPLAAALLAAVSILVAGIVVSTTLANENAALARQKGELAAAEAAAKAVAEQQAEAVRQANRELAAVVTFQKRMLADVDASAMGAQIRRAIVERAAAERRTDIDTGLAGVDFTGVALATLWTNVFEGVVAAIDAQFKGQPLVQADLLQTAANALRGVGLLQQAVAPQQTALAIRRTLLGERHRDTLASLVETGALQKLRGKFSDAEPLLRQGMAGLAEVGGSDHREEIIAAANLGVLLVESNRLDEAEPLLRDVVARSRASLGEDDAQTLSNIGILSMLLHARSLFTEAEQLGREAFEGMRRVLGDDDMRTVSAMGQLGFLVQASGDLEEAEPLLQDALRATRRLLGEDHPTSIRAVHNLAALLLARGKYDEAEPHLRDALARCRRILGEDFPETLTAWNNLAAFCSQQGRLQEAEAMHRDIARHSRRVMGEDHPETVNAVMSIGALLNRQGRYEEAESFLREAEQSCIRIHGGEHAETLMTRTQLAECLQGIGRSEEAEALQRSVLEVARRTLGDDHPYTMTALHGLGDLMRQQQRFAEAESYIRSNLASARRVFGVDHSNTVGLSVMLGEVLHELGRLGEAEPLLVEALAQRRRTFGDDSPFTLQVTRILAELLVQTRRHAEGRDLLLAAEGSARRIWPSTSRRELGAFLCLLGVCRVADGALPEAEANLLEARSLFRSETPPLLGGLRRCATALAELHEAWHAREPGAGHDQQAARWRQEASSPPPTREGK